jgi:hypothetical protein
MSRYRLFFAALLACGFVVSPAVAQEPTPETAEEQVDPQELMRQIRRNLLKIEDELQKVEAAAAAATSADAKRDLDKLVETLRRRQDQVTKDIDEIVRQMKAQGGGGGSGSSQSKSKSKSNSDSKSNSQSSGKSGAKNRNQSEGGKKNDGSESGAQDPKDGQGRKDQKGGKKDQKGGKQDPKDDPEQGDGKPESGAKGGSAEKRNGPLPENPKGRVVVRPNVNEAWGRLPKEVRQKLTDRNFEDFTPEYEEEVKEYLRRTNIVDS